jgi:hypothetical protein
MHNVVVPLAAQGQSPPRGACRPRTRLPYRWCVSLRPGLLALAGGAADSLSGYPYCATSNCMLLSTRTFATPSLPIVNVMQYGSTPATDAATLSAMRACYAPTCSLISALNVCTNGARSWK